MLTKTWTVLAGGCGSRFLKTGHALGRGSVVVGAGVGRMHAVLDGSGTHNGAECGSCCQSVGVVMQMGIEVCSNEH